MIFDNLALIDIETTGASAPYDRIIEIGILRIEKNKVVRSFETLINPGGQISPFIENLTGITNGDLESAPSFSEIKSDLAEMLDGCIFVAHNARFDYSFIRSEFRKLGISYSAKQLCTVKLSRTLFPQASHHNLDSIIERFDIKCKRRHRAFDDAKVMWDFLQILPKVVSEKTLKNAYERIVKKPAIPLNLPADNIDTLPEASGVYIFYGDGEVPLYIGKSVNIKERVLSHFIGDVDLGRELEISQQIKRIETIKTGGELGALLLESELIKKMQPLYNRKLRKVQSMVILKKKINEDGYFTLENERIDKIEHEEIENVLGIFKSQKQAKEHAVKLVKEYNLCDKYLGIQKTKGECFAYQLGWCKGACKKKESPTLFNARFVFAFAKTKLKSWPFQGPILVKEKNYESGMEEAHIFDKWCYLGKFDEFENTNTTGEYDYDIYKILKQYIGNPKNRKKISTIVLNTPSVSFI